MCFKSLPLLQQGQNIMLHVALSNHGKNNIGKAQGWPFKGSSKVAVQFYDFYRRRSSTMYNAWLEPPLKCLNILEQRLVASL